MASFLEFLHGQGLLGSLGGGKFPDYEGDPQSALELARRQMYGPAGGSPTPAGTALTGTGPLGGNGPFQSDPFNSPYQPQDPFAQSQAPQAPQQNLPPWATANNLAPVPGAPPASMQTMPASLNTQPQPMPPQPPPQMPPQAPQQEPGFGGRISMAMQGLINPSAPFTYNALRQSGVPHAQALLAATAPEVAPKFGVIGKDIAGNDQYGWINSTAQTVTPLTGGSIGAPKDEQGNPLQGQDLLSHLEKTDPTAAAQVKAIIRGDAGITGRNLQKYSPIANLVDPTLQQFNYDVRKKTALEFGAGGKAANNVKSLETVGGHIDKMISLFENLGNSWQPEYNSIKNWVSVRGGKGDVAAFETAANGVSNELGTVFRSFGMSDAEVKSWRDRISGSQSPEQFNATMSTLLDMLKTRKEALLEQYRNGGAPLGNTDFFPKLDKAIAGIEGHLSGKTQATAAPASGWTVKRVQ